MDSDPSDPLDWENWTGDLPFWQHALCGSIAGIMEHISLFPLDTIKTRLQTDSSTVWNPIRRRLGLSELRKNKDLSKSSIKLSRFINKDYSGKINLRHTAGANRDLGKGANGRIIKSINRDLVTDAIKKLNGESTLNAFRNTYRDLTAKILRNLEFRTREGPQLYSNLFRGNLFRGSNVIAAGCVPAHVLYFTVYEKLKSAGSVAFSGASATICHDLVLTPADVVKQRLQLGCYRNSIDCFSNILRNEGVNALFRSLKVTLLMNIPYHSLLVTIIHLLKRGRKNENIENYKHFLFAGFGGAVAGALTTPFDVIKTRLQTQTCSFDSKSPKLRLKYKNIWETFENIYRKEGLRGFTRGVTTRVGMCTPSAAISWGTYETLKNLIKLIN